MKQVFMDDSSDTINNNDTNNNDNNINNCQAARMQGSV
jgi:hypothetical protein